MKPVSVCQGCRNKVPQAGQLKRQRLIVSRSGGWTSKIKVSAGLVPSEAVRGICSWPLPQRLAVDQQSLASLGLYKHHPDLCLHVPVALSLCAWVRVQISPFYKDTSHIGLGAPVMTSS